MYEYIDNAHLPRREFHFPWEMSWPLIIDFNFQSSVLNPNIYKTNFTASAINTKHSCLEIDYVTHTG